jgi:hypothetical protein
VIINFETIGICRSYQDQHLVFSRHETSTSPCSPLTSSSNSAYGIQTPHQHGICTDPTATERSSNLGSNEQCGYYSSDPIYNPRLLSSQGKATILLRPGCGFGIGSSVARGRPGITKAKSIFQLLEVERVEAEKARQKLRWVQGNSRCPTLAQQGSGGGWDECSKRRCGILSRGLDLPIKISQC